MNPDAQRQAQQRADRIAAFRAELADLEREQGLTLTADQRSRLDAHLADVLSALTRQYGIAISDSAKRISWGMRIATFLGAVAFFAALVLFLHRIWGVLPSFAHAPLLVAIPLLLLAAAEGAFRRGVDVYYTALLVLAAGTGFVMELNALGSTYNVTPTAHALLAWAAFALLTAYAYGLRLLLGAGLLLFCAYTAALWVAARGGFWANFLDRAEFLIPPAAALYAVPMLKVHREPHDFDFVYRLCGAATALTALLIVSEKGEICCLDLSARAVEVLGQLAGLALSAAVIFHGLRLGRIGLVNLGATAFIVFLYVRLHAWWWDWMPKYLFFLLIGMIAIVLLLVFRRMRTRLSERIAS
ncbi:MAG: DUF2157 domain-containing protein [Chloroflexi bacterium]|nr:DUF2157 domain-containing protein [Chloroflexota bacterium]